jgi:chromosome segregation ATPase
MQWATQRVQRDFKATANKKNTETDSGIIEEIQCINFMCHEHLTVTLGPLINFIIGHNGSGKSAVLTALTICLGGKATATNRAQNLKSLIKEGKDHCSVQVRIKNQGPLAYKPAYYGKSITVERHFTRSGVSGFKLKDANGKIVSTKKAELEDILDAFSMQIDNPMNVLTQDMARQFLNHSTPKDKYRFFLQGTQLENLSRDYLQIEQSLELMNTRAEVKKADIGQLRKRMEDLAAKARRAESLEKMRAREKEIVHQALWAKVEAQEQEVVRADTELEKHARVIDRRQELVQEASDAYDRSNQASDAAQQEVTDLTVQREPAKQEALALKTVFDDSKAKLFVLKADERTITADISAKGKLVVKHKAEIKALERRQEEADNGLHAAKKKELDDAKEECERANAANSMYGDELPGIQAEMQTAQANAQSTEQNLRRAQDGERQIRNNIQQLRGGQRNWIDAYQKPGNLDKLLQAIGDDRSFREKPVGPMGRHVTLLQSEWGYILEKQFGAALNAFVVTSRADQARLSDLMKRCNWSATIYIGKSAPMDTQQHEPAPELLTWLRALKIDDHLVRNQLIINQQIDQVVLIGERAKGADFMHGRDSNTRNVKMCFTFADGDRRKGRLYNYTSSGGVNNSPIDEYRGQLRMQADKEDQIRGEQARHDATKREVRDLEQALRHAVHQVDECKGKELDYVRRKKQLKIELQRAQSTVDRLEGELSDSTPDAAAIEVLQESLTNAEVELGRAEKLYEDMVIQVDQLDVVIRENKTRLEAAQRIEKELDFKLTKAQATVKKYQSQREEDLRSKNSAIAQVTAAESNRALWEEAQRDAQADLDAKVLEAQAECPERVPVPTGKDTKALLKQLAGLQATRRLAEKELGSSQADILRQANEAKKIHQEARREFDDIEGLKSVSRALKVVVGHLTDDSLAFQYNAESPSQPLATVPFWHLCPSACYVQLPPKRAEVSWHTEHRPQEVTARHSCKWSFLDSPDALLIRSGTTRHHRAKWRWSADQDTFWR